MAAKRSALNEYPGNAVDGRGHVEALSSVLAAFGKSVRKAISDAGDLGELDTADLFTGVSRASTSGCGSSRRTCRPSVGSVR